MMHIENDKEVRFSNLILLLLILPLYYYSYRYIFQYNSAVTSPTYSATPFLFQICKYLMLALLLARVAMLNLSRKDIITTPYFQKELFLLSVFCLLFFLHGLIEGINQSLIMFIAPIICCMYGGWHQLDVEKYEKWLYVYFIYALVYEAVQIFLFFKIGRLPALAYEGSTSVRFGGPLDDPNGFGILMAFFIPFVYIYVQGRKRYIMSFFAVIMLFLSQSGTAIVASVAGIACTYVINKTKSQQMAFFIKIGCLGFLIIQYLYEKGTFLKAYMEQKQGSIDGHANSYEQLMSIDLLSFIGGFSGIGGESDFVNYIGRLGIFFYLLLLNIYVTHIREVKEIIYQTDSAFWNATYSFQIAFVLAMFNLPVTVNFAIALFSTMLIFISMVIPSEDD